MCRGRAPDADELLLRLRPSPESLFAWPSLWPAVAHMIAIDRHARWWAEAGVPACARAGGLSELLRGRSLRWAGRLRSLSACRSLYSSDGMSIMEPASSGRRQSQNSTARPDRPVASARQQRPEPVAGLPQAIEVRGWRHNTLRDLDVDILLWRTVVGVSGSGKMSLAIGALYAEGMHRFLDGLSSYSRRRLSQSERPDFDRISHLPLALALRHRPPIPG